MNCSGSADLDRAIPGWEPPVEDPMKGQKGVGTHLHAILEQIANRYLITSTSYRLRPAWFDITDVAYAFREFAKFPKRKRIELTQTLSDFCDWLDAETPMRGRYSLLDHLTLMVKEDMPPRHFVYISDCLEYIYRIIHQLTLVHSREHISVYPELRLAAGWTGQEHAKTTCDLVIISPSELHVLDYKAGTIPVYSEGNPQLLYYIATVLHTVTAPSAGRSNVVHILQRNNFSEYFIPPAELKQFEDDALEAVQRIKSGDLTLTPGDHCTFCPANPQSRGDKGYPNCPAMAQFLYPPIIDEDEILEF